MSHETRSHALLSPSAAHRWMNCTAAPSLELQFPDTTSESAKEGTLAHEICERKLRGEPWGDLEAHELYKPEMHHYTDAYVSAVDTERVRFPTDPYVVIEQRLDLSDWIPGGFGTADCILIGNGVLEVIDFKYGKGVPVDAVENPQMMVYALGAVARYRLAHTFNKVRMKIVQPRIDNFSEWECSVDELMSFGEKVRTKAEIALSNSRETIPGDWCRFCRARQCCRARADENVRLAFAVEKKPPLLSNEEVGDYLILGRQVSKWLGDLEEYALMECLAGRKIKGWKAVAGRSVRKFDNTDRTFRDLIDNGIDEAILYERTPLTLSAVEKLLGKTQFEKMVGHHVVKPKGRPTLVPESDKRDAVTNTVPAKEAFKY